MGKRGEKRKHNPPLHVGQFSYVIEIECRKLARRAQHESICAKLEDNSFFRNVLRREEEGAARSKGMSDKGQQFPFQILSAFAVSFGPFAVGLGKGYTSPALASMQSPGDGNQTASLPLTSLHVTEQQGSWIASLSLLGALFGGLFAGVVIKYGRRRTLYTITVPFAASWLLTVFATSVEMICVTAFLVGFFSAIIQLATQVIKSNLN